MVTGTDGGEHGDSGWALSAPWGCVSNFSVQEVTIKVNNRE